MASNATRLTTVTESAASQNASNKDLPWFALRVKSNCEKITSLALQGRGYDEFLPTYRRIQLSPNRLKTKAVELPLFPGYVFARFHQQNRLPVLMLPGVLYVVSIGKEPAPLDDSRRAGRSGERSALGRSGECFEYQGQVPAGGVLDSAAALRGGRGLSRLGEAISWQRILTRLPRLPVIKLLLAPNSSEGSEESCQSLG